jgi:hypothetical protein
VVLLWLLLLPARWENGLAIIQAEFATQLLLQLRKVAAASPSKYSQVAGQLGLLLQLPVQLRRLIETADDFVQTAAKVHGWQRMSAMPHSSSSMFACSACRLILLHLFHEQCQGSGTNYAACAGCTSSAPVTWCMPRKALSSCMLMLCR